MAHGTRREEPKASPAGADLVGFATVKDRTHFAFGEVKTSSELAGLRT